MQRDGGGGSSNPPCAACKYGRRKCGKSCELAPYFPAEKNREFQMLRYVFGMSNLSKKMMRIDENDRARAAEALVWEAEQRQLSPVSGSYGVCVRLQEEMDMLRQVISQWMMCNEMSNGKRGSSSSSNSSHNNIAPLTIASPNFKDRFDYVHVDGNLMQEVGGVVVGGTKPPCAACKHQRRSCKKSCKLAPYFPAEKKIEFQIVQEAFGVSNLTKMLIAVEEEERAMVVVSLVWEADQRLKDPISGCYGLYLRQQEELNFLRGLITQPLAEEDSMQYIWHKLSSSNNNMSLDMPMDTINYVHSSRDLDSELANLDLELGNYLPYVQTIVGGIDQGSNPSPVLYHPIAMNGYNPHYYIKGEK